jgi:LysM repeat protein
MRCSSAVTRCLIASLLAALLSGCFPSSGGGLDEQKDPYYLTGRSRVSSHDFDGAIDQFEKALENNPRSASAHLELGWLYDQHRKDPAAAIYHYQRHLKLRPGSDYTDRVKARIQACKVELARTVILNPVTQDIQRDLERLNAENVLLKRQIDSLQTQLVNRTAVAEAQQAAARTQPAPIVPAPAAQPVVHAAAEPRPAQPAPARNRTHEVKSGETMISIARQHGVELRNLLEANPNVNPQRMQVGQVIVIPGR